MSDKRHLCLACSTPIRCGYIPLPTRQQRKIDTTKQSENDEVSNSLYAKCLVSGFAAETRKRNSGKSSCVLFRLIVGQPKSQEVLIRFLWEWKRHKNYAELEARR
jgi:hypothetical protein